MKIVHISWFGCDECEKSFQSVDHLSVHKEKHELAVRCSLCNYLSISKEFLRKGGDSCTLMVENVHHCA